MVGRTPEDVAKFLAKTAGLNKTMIGEYLGEREEMCLKVMHAYVDAMDFEGQEFDVAIRYTPASCSCSLSHRLIQCFGVISAAASLLSNPTSCGERKVQCNGTLCMKLSLTVTFYLQEVS